MKTEGEIRTKQSEVDAQMVTLSNQLEKAKVCNDQIEIRVAMINRRALKGQLELLNWILSEGKYRHSEIELESILYDEE